MNPGTQSYQLDRALHPPISMYWVAESGERGRPVILYELSCLFCKRTIISDFRGEISIIVNAPASLAEFGMAMTARCKQCKQHYRFIVGDSFLG